MKRLGYLIPVTIVGFIVFFVVTSSDIATYKNHILHKAPLVSGEQQFLSEVTLRTGPISEGWIIQMINNAYKRVWVGIYTFTLPDMREALLRAQKRGVDVRVILEKNPYGSTNINRETRLFFEENHIPLHESDHTQFAFMHAKYAIIDSDWMVETANWTRASFATNREFFMVGDDEVVRANLETLFEKDFSGDRGQSSDIRLLAGPINARERLTDFIGLSKKSISLYAPSLSDKDFIESLNRLCEDGRSVRVILAEYDDEKNDSDSEYGECIQIRFLKKPLHAKAILIDKQKAFIGSFNFTKNALENNREMGIFLSGDAINDVFQTFESDWRQSEVALQ